MSPCEPFQIKIGGFKTSSEVLTSTMHETMPSHGVTNMSPFSEKLPFLLLDIAQLINIHTPETKEDVNSLKEEVCKMIDKCSIL